MASWESGSQVPSLPGSPGGVFVCSWEEEPGPGPPRPPVCLPSQVAQDRLPAGAAQTPTPAGLQGWALPLLLPVCPEAGPPPSLIAV